MALELKAGEKGRISGWLGGAGEPPLRRQCAPAHEGGTGSLITQSQVDSWIPA